MLEADGLAFWVRLEAAVAEAADGAPVCRVVMSNITGRKRMEEALQKASDEIRTLRGNREMGESQSDRQG